MKSGRPPALLLLLFVATSCRNDMHDQPRYEPLQASEFFADGRSARPLVEGTIPRGHLRADTDFYTGKSGEQFIETIPLRLTDKVLERGRERYEIYCSPCHDRVGGGNGVVVQRGFRRPQTFHSERLREQPAGYFFDVITNGFGAMYDYSEQVAPRDRWAIVAYIRALQLSQYAALADVPPAARVALEESEEL